MNPPANEQYVYGVVPGGTPSPGGTGVRRRRVRLVQDGEVAAIVTDAPAEALDARREHLIAHARVLERALQRGAVLPMRFGVVMSDAGAVREQLLADFHHELIVQLSELAGKVELRVHAVYDESALMSELDAAAIVDALAPLAVAVDASAPEHEPALARVSFLVEQARIDEFDAAVDELGRRNRGRLLFKYTGPLPAYSFVDLPARV